MPNVHVKYGLKYSVFFKIKLKNFRGKIFRLHAVCMKCMSQY